MFDLFVSDKLPDQVMSDVIQAWLRDFSENHALYRAMGVESLTIRPVMFGFVLEAIPGAIDEALTPETKEVANAGLVS